MYSFPSFGYNEARKSKLENILGGNNNIAAASIGLKSFYKLQKLALEQGDTGTVEAYQKLREQCDNKAYSVKELDAIGDAITDAITPIIRPIIKTVQSMAAAAKPASEEAGKMVGEGLSRAASTLSADSRIYKLAKIYDSNFDEFKFIEKQILLLASDKGIKARSLEELSYKISHIKKEAGALDLLGRGIAGTGKGIGGMALKSIPFIGIVTDSTMMCKNIYEAWRNGSKIVSELPLGKYGVSLSESLIPTPSNTKKVGKQLEDLCETYKESPDNLSEILNISQTLKGYATDFVSTITNFLMSILDILEFTGLGALVSFVLSIPIMAVEMANDTVVERAYEASIELIRGICDNKISELNSIPPDQRDFMRQYLAEPTDKGEAMSDVSGATSPTDSASKTSRLNYFNSLMKVCL